MSKRTRGEGSITQRQDNRWQAALQIDGKRCTVYGSTRSEVAAKLGELQRQMVRSGFVASPGKRTVSVLLDAWIEIKAPTWKPTTLLAYRTTCDVHLRPAFGDLLVKKLSVDRIERFLSAHHDHPRTALKCYQVLSQSLGAALRWGWIPHNPCARIDPPRYRPDRKELWSGDSLRRFLLDTRDHWLHPLWMLLAYTGCRVGETLALTWQDVDLGLGTTVINKSVQRVDGAWVVTSPKTRSGTRVISLPSEAVQVLRRQAERCVAQGISDLVFPSGQGTPLHATTVTHAMRRECDRLGLPRLTPHGLRHLHASLLLAQGLPIPAVSQRLGHANAAITMSTYAHFLGRDDAQATEAIGRALGQRS